jgi:hypothetical protein
MPSQEKRVKRDNQTTDSLSANATAGNSMTIVEPWLSPPIAGLGIASFAREYVSPRGAEPHKILF